MYLIWVNLSNGHKQGLIKVWIEQMGGVNPLPSASLLKMISHNEMTKRVYYITF